MLFPQHFFLSHYCVLAVETNQNRALQCFSPSGGTQSVTNVSLRHNTLPEILIPQDINFAYLTAFLVNGEHLGMSHSGLRHLPCISVVIWSHASLNTFCVFQAWPGLAVVQAVKRWPSTVEAWLRHPDVSMWDLWCSLVVVQVSVRVLLFYLVYHDTNAPYL
jgi:hypothetical protein